MSVPNQTPYIIYNANGLTTVFPFEFYIIAAGDIQVSINGTVVTSGFSVSGSGNISGGDVVFITPPAAGSVVMLERVVPIYRLTDYQDNGDLLADTINKDFDRLWMAIQSSYIHLGLALRRPLLGGPFNAEGYRIEKLADPINDQDAATKKYVENVSLARVLRFPESNIATAPMVSARKNKILAFNSEGNPIAVVPGTGDASDVMINLASAEEGKGDALLTVKFPAAGSTPRTQHDKNSEVLSIDDFGAKGDARFTNGSLNPNPTDDTAAIQAALIYAVKNGVSKVTATSWKSYKTSGKIYIPTTYQSAPSVSNFPINGIFDIDFNGAEFIGDSDTSSITNIFMESGYFDGNGNVQSVFGTPDEKYLTSALNLHNFRLVNYYKGLRLKGLVFISKVHDIFCQDVQQVIDVERCFYTHFEKIIALGTYTTGLARYKFHDNNNIMPLKGLVVSNCDIGYEFSGATEAMRMVDCGVEQFVTCGVKIISGGYNIKFDSCYFESSQGAGVIATSTQSISVDNCWIHGQIKMFSGFNDNTNVRIGKSNIIGGGASWWDINDGSEYNLSDISLPNEAIDGTKSLPRFVAKNTASVEQFVTLYNPASGVPAMLGRAVQTSAFQPMKINGMHTTGYIPGIVPGCTLSTKAGTPTGRFILVHRTGITFSDTQLLYINIKVNHNSGVWNWQGICIGTTLLAVGTVSAGDPPIVYSQNGFVAIDSASLPGPVIASAGGEIRLV
ncbi:phage tail fiber domain-containing protein [Cedecea sp. HN178]|uniref:phage tail fiber domain-containing protein n=1 Tax=Cedecea sp. HN178 TaxID=3081237 RepID=UPI003019C6BA